MGSMKASIAKSMRPMPIRKLRRSPYGHVFSKKITIVNRTIQGRFIKPTTTIISISPPQQPKQWIPCTSPVFKWENVIVGEGISV
jgi:hypothetical protein